MSELMRQVATVVPNAVSAYETPRPYDPQYLIDVWADGFDRTPGLLDWLTPELALAAVHEHYATNTRPLLPVDVRTLAGIARLEQEANCGA